MVASTHPARTPRHEDIVRFWVTARMRSPVLVRKSSQYIAATLTEARTMMKSRLNGSVRPVMSAKPPDSHVGDETSTLAAPKYRRRPCWMMSEAPHVSSSVSSGRP